MSTAIGPASGSLTGSITEPEAGVPTEPTPAIATLPQRWVLNPSHNAQAADLAAAAHIPLVIAELLIGRGIESASEASRFLNPHIEHLCDPFQMLGMTAAVERLELAIQRRETILLYGDYDVDGTTAVVLLKTAIEMLAGPDGS